MEIHDHEMEILKAYSILWQNGTDCNPRLDERSEEAYINGNDPLDYTRMREDERNALYDWIFDAFDFQKTLTVCPRTSYGLKHVYERQTGNYVTNGQFKGAMIHAGYLPVDPLDLNCCYLTTLYDDVENEK